MRAFMPAPILRAARVLLLAAALLPAPALLRGEEADSPRTAWREVVGRHGLQEEMPARASGTGRFPPGGRRQSIERGVEGPDGRPPARRDRTPMGGGGGVPDGVLVALVVLVLGIAIVALVRALRHSARTTPRRAPSPRGEGATIDLPTDGLAAARELAARGAYAEAAHRLLAAALATCAASTAVVLPASATSREAVQRFPFTAGARAALGVLVDGVERSRFGGRPFGAEDWAQALAAWQALPTASSRA